MERDAYDQYAAESQGWLHRGRQSLLARLLNEACGTSQDLDLLDVGAGVGQNLAALGRYGCVDAAEIDPVGIERIRADGFARHLYTERIPFDFARKYDVICAMDVIEHLEDDAGALRWMTDGLVPGGHLVLSVPAYQWMFSDHDRALGHYRRYAKRTVLAVLPPQLRVTRAGYFNTALFPAAALSRGLAAARRGRAATPGGPLRKQSSRVPRSVDAAFGAVLDLEASLFSRRPIMPFGLSVFVLAQSTR